MKARADELEVKANLGEVLEGAQPTQTGEWYLQLQSPA